MSDDIVFCEGLEIEVEIGFHEVELGITQKVLIDLELSAPFAPGPTEDRLEGLVDYFELARLVDRAVVGRRFRLVEALAVAIARACVEAHPHARARVRVSKRPLDMPTARCFGAECVRTAADFAR